MARNYVRDNVPLSRFGVLVAQLESIVTSAAQQAPEPLLCFDLLSDLISAIDDEPKESILLWQRKCEDTLYSLLIIGARRPVRHLASVAMAEIISKGDSISIYSRVSSLQGFLSDGKRNEPQKVAGATQCLGELYRHFGRRITSGLHETTIIAMKLFKFHEEFVRQQALHMLQNALEGSGGSAAASAYTESFRLIMRSAVGDKSFVVRIAAARCLKAFAIIGGPGLGVGELENSASYCVKALEDTVPSVRDAFAEALGSLLALGMNPDAQAQPRGKGPQLPAKKIEGGLQRFLTLPFAKASGPRSKDTRIGITLSWVFFLQAIRLKYLHPDIELQDYAVEVLDILRSDASVDSHALACVLYILRVGVTNQMTEPTQRNFLIFLGKQLQSSDASPSIKIAALRTLSYALKMLGKVPSEFKEMLDNSVVAAVSHSSQLEIDLFHHVTWRHPEDGIQYSKMVEKDRIFDFLHGLNQDLDEVRGRILGTKPLPSLKEAFAEVRREETRKKVMSSPSQIDSPVQGSALATNRDNRKVFSTKDQQLWCEYCKKPYHTKETCWNLHGKDQQLWCEYCKKPYYTKEKCWNLHEKPPDWKPRNQRKNNRNANIAEITTVAPRAFTAEEMEALRKLMNPLSSKKGGNPCCFIRLCSFDNSERICHRRGRLGMLRSEVDSTMC